jgi:ABC-type multidrug transport system fused ATPase/permease subunit
MDPRTTYEDGRTSASREVHRQDARIRAIGLARAVVALGAIGLVAALVWASLSPLAWIAVSALALLFVVLVIQHRGAFARRTRFEAVRRFHERGLDRLSGRWIEFAGDGEAFRSAEHPYTDDLDVFGRASLFQLLNAAETPFGERALASLLAPPSRTDEKPPGDDRAWKETLGQRHSALQDLAGRVAFRERLSSVCHVVSTERPDPRPFIAWAETSPPLAASTAAVAASWVLPVLAILAMVFGAQLGLPRGAWIGVILVELAFLGIYRKRTTPIVVAASSREGSLARFAEVFETLERESFQAPMSRLLQEKLRASGVKVTREMAALARIVGFVDARQNEVFRLFIAPVLLWDFHCAVALDRWRLRAGPRVREWFETLGEFEALASVAGFAFDHADHAWPELVDRAAFEASDLGHPLLGADRRVTNEVALPGPGNALIVTGSNMSGKSTLLRAIGLNAVLALAGAPVCAKKLVLGRVTVATSMRVRDSLEAGISHFLAELTKLKRVVDLARTSPPVLFLLDEILHGTNSRERLIGARAIVRTLTDLGALGAVSTHDLGIAERTPDLEGRVTNVHFEEQVDEKGTMTFDYKLKAGVVHTSNALRLMRAVGLDVAEE